MIPLHIKLLTFSFVCVSTSCLSQVLWSESFSIPGKGVWGVDGQDTMKESLNDVAWFLDYNQVILEDENDYAGTVSTSGGRFECRDINGEVTWRSGKIDLYGYKNIKVTLNAKETGSGNNPQNKYLKAYYVLDNGVETPFETNGINLGNWGDNSAGQNGLEGDSLEIIVKMNNHYSTDKVILDEIYLSGQEINPVLIDPKDVLLNEVLFNSPEEGTDYVEIFNNSQKTLPLNRLFLASRDKNGELTQIYPLSNEPLKILPWNFLVLTKSIDAVLQHYSTLCRECFIEMEKFPGLNNNDDFVVLLNQDYMVIDELHYDEMMHNPQIAVAKGVALERISIDRNTENWENWTSASSSSGYGTPGYENSMVLRKAMEDPKVKFTPDAFSPNSDGYKDEFKIILELDNSGYRVNISVYDALGRFVTHLAKNDIPGTAQEYLWTGENQSGNKLEPGVYVVLVELYNSQGKLFRFKEGVVLTNILE